MTKKKQKVLQIECEPCLKVVVIEYERRKMYAMLDSKRKTGILLPASHSSLLLLLLPLLVNIYASGKVSEKPFHLKLLSRQAILCLKTNKQTCRGYMYMFLECSSRQRQGVKGIMSRHDGKVDHGADSSKHDVDHVQTDGLNSSSNSLERGKQFCSRHIVAKV